ncbi:MAG: TRAP transporter TatT component family protein [Chromatiales bacterium]
MAARQLTGNLATSMLNQDDPDTVRAAIPAYLLLLDGMIRDDPDDPQLLISAAQLYGAFAAGLVEDAERSQRLSEHAKTYAKQALCIELDDLCVAEANDFGRFTLTLAQVESSDLPVLYAYATSCANWIKNNSGDWNALAQLPRVEAMLQRIIELEPGYARGRAQLYLAVLRSQLPASLGGKPESGRQHFDLALQYSAGRDLMAKVEYARTYARLVFDQKLHDRLLQEVAEADPVEPNLTLSNILAQQKAKELLNDNYF